MIKINPRNFLKAGALSSLRLAVYSQLFAKNMQAQAPEPATGPAENQKIWMNANLLLNVGPMTNGKLRPEDVEILTSLKN